MQGVRSPDGAQRNPGPRTLSAVNARSTSDEAILSVIPGSMLSHRPGMTARHPGYGIGTPTQADIASAESTWLRSRNFWILPVDVLGIGPNTTAFGVLKPDM